MVWLIFSLLTALFESLKDVFGKQQLQDTDEYMVAWAWRFFALPFLLPLLLIEIPSLDRTFWVALLVSGGMNSVTAVLYMKAIRASDLSLSVPMLTFTPLFLLLTSPVLLGEMPGVAGVFGIFLIVAGSYLLKVKERGKGLLAPFRALVGERGPRLMLLVAFVWSITANVDKIGLQHSSPLFWAVAINTFIALLLTPLVLFRRGRQPFPRGFANWVRLFPVGAAGGLTSVCQMVAVSLALVPYVIAIKRSSTLLSVLWGHFLFGERGIRERLGGASVMAAGLFLILLD